MWFVGTGRAGLDGMCTLKDGSGGYEPLLPLSLVQRNLGRMVLGVHYTALKCSVSIN